ncbi:MAG: exodeoxyribonuclease VII large subunit [Elusimicrobiota bacterium]|jgi:exodeoxyribonuclease VII large subunit
MNTRSSQPSELPFASTPERPLSISEISSGVRELLEAGFSDVWVCGEISQPKAYDSGHTYFTLKDAQAQLAAVLFRGAASGVRFKLEHGLEVLARGRVSHYPGSGRTQLIVSEMRPKSAGSLQLAFEQLKAKLEAEGLFAQERKRPLPAVPERIGVVTSLQGAALRDILSVLRRRFDGLHVRILPVPVQGEGAALRIAQAIEDFNEFLPDTDVLLVGRGGGSLEDLWAFNEEPVARAIAASVIPVVSCVGHETDFTIADFVADVRAATPSAAAELAAPDKEALQESLALSINRLRTALRGLWEERSRALARLTSSPVLRDGRRLYEDRAQRVDELLGRLPQSLRQAVLHLGERLRRLGPQRLAAGMGMRMEHARKDLALRAGKLDALSPLAVLGRGYAVAQREDGRVIYSAAELKKDERVRVRVCKGDFTARVE